MGKLKYENRTSFVSNSSSSSFIINKHKLSETQIEQIINHIDVSIKLTENNHNYEFYNDYDDAWGVDIKEDTILVSTFMDNFDMSTFLSAIGVDENAITYQEY